MRKAQLVRENLTLSKALLQRILNDPSYIEEIPEDAQLIMLPLDDPELFKANLGQLMALKEQGEKNVVVIVLETAKAHEPRVLVRV